MRKLVIALVALIPLIAAAEVAQSQAPAQVISVTPQYFRIADFKLQSGELLKEMVVE
jgi:hypothetical protein